MHINTKELQAFIQGNHNNPHHILGTHTYGTHSIVRASYPEAKAISIFDKKSGHLIPMQRIGNTNIFEAVINEDLRYLLQVTMPSGTNFRYEDSYRFSSTLTNDDLFLFNQGRNFKIYEKLGAHTITHEGITGYSFAVWAPNARRVSVVGDFNHWDGRIHPMRLLNDSGVWEIFIPNLNSGLKYKFEIYDTNKQIQLKADPYGNFGEYDKEHASILTESLDNFHWHDQNWLQKREQQNCREIPISIYELHIDSWERDGSNEPLNYKTLARHLVEYLRLTHFNYVEFMPITEYPFLGSWGYQVTGFFAPTSRYGTPQDFQYLIDVLHENNIGVIIDWVPAHFPKDSFGLAKFDGTALYEHADPRQGEHQDWGTLIFNYGRNEVRNFLTSNALFWMDKFHVDGLRIDAVASMLYLNYSRKNGEWIPNRFGGKENIEAIEFLRNTNDLIHQYHPGTITIAEESTSFGRVSQPTQAYGLGFDFKWNMGWMHDVLSYCKEDPIHRKFHHNKMTFAMLYQYSENFIQTFSHDEVVHGKCSMVQKMGSGFFSDKLSTLRALYAYMWGWPGKKTLFMGNEFAQINEWDYHKSLDWHLLEKKSHKGIQHLIGDLNTLYFSYDYWSRYDMYQEGFLWSNPNDCDCSVFSFMRRDPKSKATLLFISNFTPVERMNYECWVPWSGKWQEVLNTDAPVYDGLGRGNDRSLETKDGTESSQWNKLTLYLPPLSTRIFEYIEL